MTQSPAISDVVTPAIVQGVLEISMEGYSAFSSLRAEWRKDNRFRIKIKDQPTFEAMVDAFKKHVHPSQLPPFFNATKENGKLMLTMIISKQSLIKKYNTSLNADPVLYYLYNSIIVGFVESLKLLEKGTGLFSSLTKDDDHHPFVIFACEFIHWAHTELVHYQMDDERATNELENRQKYLQACHDIRRLIPSNKGETEKPTIVRYLAHVNDSIRTTKEKLTVLQKYNVFKRSIEGLSQNMLKVLETSLKSQYFMISDLPNGNFFPAEIRADRTDGFEPLKELERARETILFKHIELFLNKINCPGNDLIWSTPPQDINAVFSKVIKAFTIENLDENGQYKGISGFDETIFNASKQTLLLGYQKEYLIELIKWLQSAILLKQFIQLHNFREAKWGFCGKRGGLFLEALLNIIGTIEKSILKQHHNFFEDYFKYGETLIIENPGATKPKRFKIISDLDIEMRATLQQIKEHKEALAHEKEKHAASKVTFDLLERSIIKEILFLSDQIPGIGQNLKHELATISSEIHVTPNEVTKISSSLKFSFDTQSAIEEQHLLEVAIAKVLRLRDKFSFPYTLDEIKKHLKKNASQREQIVYRLLTIKLFVLIAARIRNNVNPHIEIRWQMTGLTPGAKDRQLSDLETSYSACGFLNTEDKISLLSQILNLALPEFPGYDQL